MPTKYRSVLAEPGALRLMSTALVGRLPQGMSSLVILLLVREATHSYAAAGVAVGANALLAAVCAPLAGRLVDRLGRRVVLGPVAVLLAGAYVLLAVLAADHAGALALIACAGLAGALVPPIAPVVRTVLRDLFDDLTVRETAFGLEAIAQETIWITGPLIVTVAITLASPKAACVMLGVVVVGGTLLFLRSPLLDRTPEHLVEHVHRGSALASLDLRWLLLPATLMGFSLGAVEVGIPALALHHGSRAASGFLLAIWSLGSMAGGLRYSSMRWRAPLGSRYAPLLLASCVFTAPLVVAGSIPVAGACCFIAGLAIAPTFTCQYSLVGRVVIPGTEHEAFSWTLSGLIAGVAAGSALGGVSVGAVGVSAPFVLGCAASLLAAAAATRFRGRFGSASPLPEAAAV